MVKYSPNGRQLAAGNHENHIDLYDVRQNYHHRKRLSGHSSYVMKLDWSADSKLLVSNCGAYEILYWDAIKVRTRARLTVETRIEVKVWTMVEAKVVRESIGRDVVRQHECFHSPCSEIFASHCFRVALIDLRYTARLATTCHGMLQGLLRPCIARLYGERYGMTRIPISI